jgi:hypothetical protein
MPRRCVDSDGQNVYWGLDSVQGYPYTAEKSHGKPCVCGEGPVYSSCPYAEVLPCGSLHAQEYAALPYVTLLLDVSGVARS